MKKTLLALPLGLILALSATSAFANTGTINFKGAITAVTCGVEVIDPTTGMPGNGSVNMGNVEASRFAANGHEHFATGFSLRVDPSKGGCTVLPDAVGNVTFTGPGTGDHFTFRGGANSATGVVAVIKDKSGASLGSGKESADYDLNATLPTDMRFDVYYKSIANAVTAGPTEVDVAFTVAIN